MALEINTPRHDWYQRRYHVRLPRMAECKATLDATFFDVQGPPPVVPVGWNFGMRIGIGAGGFFNGSVGFLSPARVVTPSTPAYGALTPSTFSGELVGVLGCTSADTAMFYPGAVSVQLPGINFVTMTVEGYAGVAPRLNWNAGNGRYNRGTEPVFNSFLLSKMGQVVGVTLVGSAS